MDFELLIFCLKLYLAIGAIYSLLFITQEDSQNIIANLHKDAMQIYKELSIEDFTVLMSLFFFCVFTVLWLPVIVISLVGGYSAR